MARILILIAVALTYYAAFCLTENIEDNDLIKSVISDGDGNPVADIGEAKIGIPTIEILKALDGQIPDDVGRAAGFFNLTAYLTTNAPNGTAGLTFVPLITLLLGIANINIG